MIFDQRDAWEKRGSQPSQSVSVHSLIAVALTICMAGVLILLLVRDSIELDCVEAPERETLRVVQGTSNGSACQKPNASESFNILHRMREEASELITRLRGLEPAEWTMLLDTLDPEMNEVILECLLAEVRHHPERNSSPYFLLLARYVGADESVLLTFSESSSNRVRCAMILAIGLPDWPGRGREYIGEGLIASRIDFCRFTPNGPSMPRIECEFPPVGSCLLKKLSSPPVSTSLATWRILVETAAASSDEAFRAVLRALPASGDPRAELWRILSLNLGSPGLGLILAHEMYYALGVEDLDAARRLIGSQRAWSTWVALFAILKEGGTDLSGQVREKLDLIGTADVAPFIGILSELDCPLADWCNIERSVTLLQWVQDLETDADIAAFARLWERKEGTEEHRHRLLAAVFAGQNESSSVRVLEKLLESSDRQHLQAALLACLPNIADVDVYNHVKEVTLQK